MKKEEAKQRLTSIENEVKELRKIIDAPEVKGAIIDRVKTVQDACRELGVKTYGDAYRVLRMEDRVLFSDHPIDQCDDATMNAMLFCRALNEGWWPNWDDSNERKWFPWFRMSSSGLAFEDSNSYDWSSHSAVGSRLCLKTEALSDYSAKTIPAVYKKIML